MVNFHSSVTVHNDSAYIILICYYYRYFISDYDDNYNDNDSDSYVVNDETSVNKSIITLI